MAKNTAPEGMRTADGGWMAADGSAYRSLTALEVADLLAHAESIDPADELVPAYTDGYGRELPAVTRLGDLHANWEIQHPLLREALKTRGLHPKG